MDLSVLAQLIKPELMTPMTALVLVTQAVRVYFGYPVGTELPAKLKWVYLGLNVLAAFGLALAWQRLNGAAHYLDAWYFQGPFLVGWALANHHGLKMLYGPKEEAAKAEPPKEG